MACCARHWSAVDMAERPLQGRGVVVTGGSRGIGRAIAESAAADGAAVVITSRTESDDARAAIKRLAALGGRSAHVCMDVTSTASISQGIALAAERLGRIDVLVNNAGTSVPGPALEVDEATWDLVTDTNVKGLFFSSQAAARQFQRQRAAGDDAGYAIINIASQMGLVGAANRSVYCAGKAAVVNMTRALAVEWAPLGIRVNAVAPTFVHTPLADAMLADPDFRAVVEAGSPMGRVGEPEDVAAAVLYLAGDGARLVTGHTLVVDGGWTAW
jgi:NAD(P)-dependent dehydrogenase (short-subunit alcohol dehydrogenase family)